MSDDGLFSLNSPAGRKCFVLNSVLLAIISWVLYFCLNAFIKPGLISEVYIPFLNIGESILYIFLMFLAFSLFERRIFDITGKRRDLLYSVPVFVLFIDFFLHAFILLCLGNVFSYSLPFELGKLMEICNVFDMILLIMAVILIVVPGKFNH